MKNKKLFAILTLVCFMFTLMPVAAFAADGTVKVSVGTAPAKASVSAKTNESVVVSVDGGALAAGEGYYFFAVDADGDAVKLPLNATTDSSVSFTVGTVFDVAGTYSIYAVESNGADNVHKVITDAMTTIDSKANLLLGSTYKDDRVKKAATLKVSVAKDNYDLKVYNIDLVGDRGTLLDVENGDKISVPANGSYGAKTYVVALETVTGQKPVEGVTLKVSHNGVTVAGKYVTDENGEIKIQVSGKVVGNFEIEVAYEDEELVIPVEVTPVAPAVVTTVAEPSAPVDVNTDSEEFGIGFKLVDANGNVIKDADVINNGTAPDKYQIAVLAKPADSTLTKAGLYLDYDTVNQYFEIKGITDELEEGTYTFQVALENGSTASASVNVKEFDEAVKITMNYAATAGLGDTVTLRALNEVDANGVVRSLATKTAGIVTSLANGVELAANGAAVESFDPTTGTIKVKSDDKYLGSVITVYAVYDEEFLASAEITVIEDAIELAYVESDVELAKNNTLTFNVVNANGAKIALNSVQVYPNAIVLEKPENAYVAVGTPQINNTGDGFTVSFTPSLAGEYKVQLLVRYTEDINNTPDNANDDVTRYITGIATIKVGATEGQFEDVVVVSIGATKMIVNDTVVELDVAPYIENSRTMMQYNVLGAFGFDIQWVQETRSVVAEGNGIKVVMTIGSKVATVNGEEVTLDVAPQIVNGRTVVPVGFLTGTFGINNQIIKAADGSVADILFTK